ncbi:MAG: caspase family protein [Acetobacteraceae bacterium]|nr:caspase family protein [Acetobacteraceae bacterium]
MRASHQVWARASQSLNGLLIGGLLATGLGRDPQAATMPSHFALVIGNSDYTSMPALPGCRVSAHAVAVALQRAGFAVTERHDLSNGEMAGTAADLIGQVSGTPGGTAVVYVCGYGISYAGRIFLLPVSAKLERDTDALTQGILATSYQAALGRSSASALVLLDIIPSSSQASASLQAGTQLRPPAGTASATVLEGSATAETPFADAIARAFNQAATPGILEANTVVAEIGHTLARSPGIRLQVEASPTPVYLSGAPAPVTAGSEANAPQAAAPAPRPAAAPVPAFPDEERMSDEDRRKIQTALTHLGYYDGKIDAIFGADTRAAIRRFQHEIGAPMTGRLAAGQAEALLARGG